MASSAAVVVSSAELVRRFGAWQDRASLDPIFVTHHGRRRHVLLSMTAYDMLQEGVGSCESSDADRLRLETLIAQLDGAFVALDAALRIAALNPAAGVYFGVSQAAVIGRPLGGTLPELERSVARAHINRTLTAGEVASFEMPAVVHEGEWLRCQVFPWGDGVACLLRNVTGERVARANGQARAALDAALETVECIGCGQLSLRGTFVRVGERLAAMAGFPPQALEQVRLTDILPLDRRVAAAGHVEAVLGGGAARGFESAFLVNNGGEQRVRIGVAPIRGDYAVDGATVVIARLGVPG